MKKSEEKIFKVNVIKINIINKKAIIKITRRRKEKKKRYTKTIVTIKKAQNIVILYDMSAVYTIVHQLSNTI